MTTVAVEPITTPLLELRDVDAAYGPFRAIFGVSFALDRGGVLALLGSNGAGKTTIARICSGLLAPTGGDVLFDGRVMTGQHAYRYARAGIVHAPEGRSVFASLTVEENLDLTFGTGRKRGKRSTRPTNCSRDWESGAGRLRARCRAESNACSRSRASWWNGPGS